MKGQLCRVWDGLHVSPTTAPSKRAKLCTYFAWFLRPSQLKTVPYFELPMPRLRLLMQYRMGSHALPVEQGRLARPAIPRHLRRCTWCESRALGDERHFVFDCPHFAHIRRQFRSLYQDADGTMQCLVWHRLCSNELTLFHPFSLSAFSLGCQGCCKLSFVPSLCGTRTRRLFATA